MLWESTDPVDALRARFGPDGFDDAAGWLGACLARAWDVDVQACDRILISYRNAIAWVHTGREMLVAKWSCDRSRFATLSAVADLLRALDGQQVPVAPPLASVDGRHRVVVDSGPSPLSVMVQPCVDGDLLDVADLAAVRNAGACLASLHHALAAHRDDRPAAAAPVDLRQRVERWWERGGAGKAPAASARRRKMMAGLPRSTDGRNWSTATTAPPTSSRPARRSVPSSTSTRSGGTTASPTSPTRSSGSAPTSLAAHPGPGPCRLPGGVPVGAAAHPARTPVARRGRALVRHRGHPGG